MQRVILTAVLVLAGVLVVGGAAAGEPAVTRAEGVPAHAGLDGLYERFAAGYDALDADAVAALYTPDALYLQPNQPIERGPDTIAQGFASFFGWARESGRTLSIRFEIVERQVTDDLAWDVGTFHVRTATAGEMSPENVGKFVVIAVPDGEGSWRFAVDAFSPVAARAD